MIEMTQKEREDALEWFDKTVELLGQLSLPDTSLEIIRKALKQPDVEVLVKALEEISIEKEAGTHWGVGKVGVVQGWNKASYIAEKALATYKESLK